MQYGLEIMCLDSGADGLGFNPGFAPFHLCDIGHVKLDVSQSSHL